MNHHNVVFATYADNLFGLKGALILSKSIRTFGGQFSQMPIHLYMPDDFIIEDKRSNDYLKSCDIQTKTVNVPKESKWFYYAGKVYAAAQAEADALDTCEILAWLDNDTIILEEPSELYLKSNISLSYCPVMHNRSGSDINSLPDPFWSLIYKKLDISKDLLFPMITPADQIKIRAYFQCGHLVLRPERGIFRQWARDFECLYNDDELVEMCQKDTDKRVFLHQTALTGSILHILKRNEMVHFSDKYNYPIFFEKRYDSKIRFNTIENLATIRWVVSLDDLDEHWQDQLSGPKEKILWLKEHLEQL